MPLYEYHCPYCKNKFETIRPIEQRYSAGCPNCHSESELVPSIFVRSKLNWTQKDGEGFTSKFVRKEELAEMNKECRER